MRKSLWKILVKNSASQDLEAAQVPNSRWVDKKKLWYVYTMEYYTAIKKKEILPFATAWMDLESIMLREILQLKKDKRHVISLICGTYWTKETNKQ